MLLQLGKDMGSFETVAEGYLNMIRNIIDTDDRRAVEYYDDFIAYAVESKEWYAAAMAAREVAEYSLRLGLAWDRHYLERAAELWIETAHANQAANGPVDLSANAFQSAIDAATALGIWRWRAGSTASWRSCRSPRRGGGATGCSRAATNRSCRRRLPAPAFPSVMRRSESYKEIWRDDLIEWELDGDPVTVMARLIADDADRTIYTRPALRALLKFADPSFSPTNLPALAEAAEAVGAGAGARGAARADAALRARGARGSHGGGAGRPARR